MPEGDTIHKVAAVIAEHLPGETIVRAEARARPGGTYARGRPPAERLDASVTGHEVTEVFALGKHLFILLENQLALRTHLGMHGAWHHYGPAERWRKAEWQLSLGLWTPHDVFVCFNAKEVALVRSPSIERTNFDQRLGPDLLGPELDAERIVARAREFLDAEAPLADLLLDQRVASGIGNVYKSELLFIEGLHPLRPTGETTDTQLIGLYRRARSLLRRNLGGGRRTTRFVNDGLVHLWVYGRAGEACLRCASPVQYGRFGVDLRGTYWCEPCQGNPARRGPRLDPLRRRVRRPPGCAG